MTEREAILPAILPAGPDCQNCIDRLEHTLLQTRGVDRARIDAAESHLHLWYDPELVSLEDVEGLAHRAGIELRDKFEHDIIILQTLPCPDCALTLESVIARLPGVTWASVNFAASRMLVEYEQPPATHERIAREVRRLGYQILEPGVSASLLAREGKTIGTLGCAFFGLLGFLFSHSSWTDLHPWFYAAAIISGGIPVLRGALAAVRAFNLDINFLIFLS